MLRAYFIMALLLSALAVAVLFGTVKAATDISGLPKPSVPEFTISYHAGTIELSIKNQPTGCDSTYHIFYNVRYKSQGANDWNEVYPIQTRQKSPSEVGVYIHVNLCTNQSDSEYTIISYPGHNPAVDFSASNTIDFQVEAILGHDSQRFVPDHDLAPWVGGHYVPDVAYDASSDWSSTKTITIGESQTPTPSPETTPTPPPTSSPPPTPYSGARLTEQEMLIGVAITAAVIGAGLGLLIYLIKRK